MLKLRHFLIYAHFEFNTAVAAARTNSSYLAMIEKGESLKNEDGPVHQSASRQQ